jgi:hypothetical protein
MFPWHLESDILRASANVITVHRSSLRESSWPAAVILLLLDTAAAFFLSAYPARHFHYLYQPSVID